MPKPRNDFDTHRSSGVSGGRNGAARQPLESLAWLVQIMIWNSGEAELATIHLTDNKMINKHYDLTSGEDLSVLLDELVRLLAQNQIPDAAVTSQSPEPLTRQGDTAPSS